MQSAVLELKRRTETADLTQTEIAFHSRAVSRSAVCRIFRGQQDPTPAEIQAIEAGIKAAIRAKARRLFEVMPEVFTGAGA